MKTKTRKTSIPAMIFFKMERKETIFRKFFHLCFALTTYFSAGEILTKMECGQKTIRTRLLKTATIAFLSTKN
jgi:hypothetical protein